MYQEVCNYQVLNMYQGCVLLGKYSLQYVPTTEHVPGLYARKVYCTRQPYRTVHWYGCLVRYIGFSGTLVRHNMIHWHNVTDLY